MDKYEALETIKKLWDDEDMKLENKIIEISSCFYSVGLELSATAEFLKATPAELDALLALGALDEEILKKISEANLPKTAWSLIANAGEEEIEQALDAFIQDRNNETHNRLESTSEYLYQQMIEVAEPTSEQRVGTLTGDELAHILKKGKDFNVLSDWDSKFLKSISGKKKTGQRLTDKQLAQLLRILVALAEKNVITRHSIDDDEELCDRILDAIGK